MDIVQKKAYDFALRIVRLSEYLVNQKKEFVLSRKILDSGSNIGLLIEEGKQGHDRAGSQADSLLHDCGELQGLLISSLRTARKNE
jgi:hypothetical protein